MSPSNLWNHTFKRWLSSWLGTEPKVNLPKAFTGQGGEANCQQTPSPERESAYVCPRARRLAHLGNAANCVVPTRRPSPKRAQRLSSRQLSTPPAQGVEGGTGRGREREADSSKDREGRGGGKRIKDRRLEIHRKKEKKIDDGNT